MKKIKILFILLGFIKGYTQCPVPSNLVYSADNNQDAILSWTENGNANTWEIAGVPDFYVGVPLPFVGTYSAFSNPFVYVGLPPGCNVFFVRSVCSATEVSPWIAVPTSGCSTNVYNYLATLSNDSFTLNVKNSRLQLFPNPSKSVIELKIITKIDKITIFDSVGKVVLMQTQNNNKIDIENFAKGVYFSEVYTENEKFIRKFIKE